MNRKTLAVLLSFAIMLTTVAAPAFAQDKPGAQETEEATAPAAQAGAITVGESVEAELANPEGDTWTFEGNEGDVISVAVGSIDIDPNVELLDPEGNVIASDDDSGASLLDALIEGITLPSTGTYSVVVRGFTSDESGAYTLNVSTVDLVEPGLVAYGDAATTILPAGETHAWTFEGAEGDVVSIAMIAAFDTRLVLQDPQGNPIEEVDDTYNFQSVIEGVTLPASGTYTIVAGSFSDEQFGRYSLFLARQWSGNQ